MNCYLGIDLGGTNLRFGLMNEKAQILWSKHEPTKAGSPREQMMSIMRSAIRQGLDEALQKKLTVCSIGMGVPGCVDFEKGFIHTLVNIPGWDNVPLAQILQDEFHLPVFVDNDVNVMALGEFTFGAAQGAKNVICVTLGTGVGGGVIANGALYRGSSFTAGELGHIVVQKDGPACNCGNWGCLERYIGNRYLVERALELYQLKGKSEVPAHLTPELLAKLAGQGDEIAKFVWEEAGNYLGIVLAGLVNFFNPDSIVIGGGVAQAGALLFHPLEKSLRQRSMKVPGSFVKIKPAQLGKEAGLIGAATLAMVSLR